MPIPDEKAARIQQLLQKLATSGTYEGVAIAAEIHKVAAEPAPRVEPPARTANAVQETSE